MAQHALDRGYQVVGVCRARQRHQARSAPGAHHRSPRPDNDREVIKRTVAGGDGVLTVLVPIGREHYSSGTAQAVLDLAPPPARLIFSSG